MIRITNVYQRPNTDVPFHSINMTQELFEHVKTTYKDTGKAVSVSVTKSDDLLDELEERGALPPEGDINAKEVVEQMYYLHRQGQDCTHLLDRLFYSVLGKIV